MIVAGELDTGSVDPERRSRDQGRNSAAVGTLILCFTWNDMEVASSTVDDGAVKMNEEMVDSYQDHRLHGVATARTTSRPSMAESGGQAVCK